MTDLAQNMTPSAPAAGWYPDPSDQNAKRWWSGEGWTEHVQSAPVAPVPVTVQPVAPLPVVAEPVITAPAAEAPAPPAYTAPAIPQPMLAQAPVAPAQALVPQQAIAPTAPAFVPQQAIAPTAPALNPRNVDADGVPLNLFADSVFTPDVLSPPVARADTQSDWHSRGGRSSAVRRQSGGSVSLSTGTQTGAARKHNPYERNWIAGVALVIAILSIPALGMRSLVDLPPLSQSIFAGAPIAIALLALVTSIRRSAGIVVSSIAVVIAGAVLAAGLLVDPAVLASLVDSILALLP